MILYTQELKDKLSIYPKNGPRGNPVISSPAPFNAYDTLVELGLPVSKDVFYIQLNYPNDYWGDRGYISSYNFIEEGTKEGIDDDKKHMNCIATYMPMFNHLVINCREDNEYVGIKYWIGYAKNWTWR